jgi:hypothetical protein
MFIIHEITVWRRLIRIPNSIYTPIAPLSHLTLPEYPLATHPLIQNSSKTHEERQNADHPTAPAMPKYR